MKLLLKLVALLGLLLTLVPSFLLFSGLIERTTQTGLMVAGMLVWFIAAPFWFGQKKK